MGGACYFRPCPSPPSMASDSLPCGKVRGCTLGEGNRLGCFETGVWSWKRWWNRILWGTHTAPWSFLGAAAPSSTRLSSMSRLGAAPVSESRDVPRAAPNPGLQVDRLVDSTGLQS